jgi:hypothetical protein
MRSLHGAAARVAARNASLGAWAAAMPVSFELPPRTLATPAVIPLAPPVLVLPPPISHARAPPR